MNQKMTALALSVMVTSTLLALGTSAQQVADTSFASPPPRRRYSRRRPSNPRRAKPTRLLPRC